MAEAEALAHSYHVPYVECSSRDDYQVQDAVATMVHLILKKNDTTTTIAPQVWAAAATSFNQTVSVDVKDCFEHINICF